MALHLVLGMFVGVSPLSNHPEVTEGCSPGTETLGKMQGDLSRDDNLWYELFLPEKGIGNIRTGLWQPSVHSDVAF